MSQMRLQRFLSAAGVASRRKAEIWIVEGRVTVNGQTVTELGTKVNSDKDRVEVDGEHIRMPDAPLYYLLHKPPGTVCTESDPEGRPRVHELLPPGLPRLFTVGRLDWDTEGILLFTNDGKLAKALTDPKIAVPRIYEVKIQGAPDPHLVRRFNEGVRLDDGRMTRPSPTEIIRRTKTNFWISMVLTEGKNRQIHRMTQACGRRVLKLHRVNYGGIVLTGLRTGQCRPLALHEVEMLVAAAGLKRTRRANARVQKMRAAEDRRASNRTGPPSGRNDGKESSQKPYTKPRRPQRSKGKPFNEKSGSNRPGKGRAKASTKSRSQRPQRKPKR
ncbi:MAG: pseudouridine synthase [Myxococcota bacterium]|nr:pseudouridine synthase [Myxococcota bacterium]